jgi:hypothetical protein
MPGASLMAIVGISRLEGRITFYSLKRVLVISSHSDTWMDDTRVQLRKVSQAQAGSRLELSGCGVRSKRL